MLEITGNESAEELLGVKKSPKGPILLTRQAIHRLLTRYELGELTRMELFDIAELLEGGEPIEYEPKYADAIWYAVQEMATHPVLERTINVPVLRDQFDQFQAKSWISGFEMPSAVEQRLQDPQEPKLVVGRKTLQIWMERLQDGDLSRENLIEMTDRIIRSGRLEIETDHEMELQNVLNALVDPNVSNDALVATVKGLKKP